ncbi:hypothetical protein LCGC14_0818130 [marine sediment metagenome]|uniref:N-acetyltransferase domain-containing protein n=1 Tax=marine sediment metagenome TaxID=412755 RepID=A0A0F9S4L5_9ZZZZ
MRAESIESYPPIDRDHAQKHLDMAIAMPDVFLVVLAENNGLPIGLMTAAAGPYCFSSRLRTASDLLFVLPENRGGYAAKRLIRRFKEWSNKIGADSATLSVATGISPDRTGRFFELMGFRSMGTIYQMDRN